MQDTPAMPSELRRTGDCFQLHTMVVKGRSSGQPRDLESVDHDTERSLGPPELHRFSRHVVVEVIVALG